MSDGSDPQHCPPDGPPVPPTRGLGDGENRVDRTGRVDRSHPIDGDDPEDESAATTAYRWLRVLKVLVGLVVSLLTALKLLGLLP